MKKDLKITLSFLVLLVTSLCNQAYAHANYALSFDGVDDYVQVDTAVIPATGDFTISVWAKPDSSKTGTQEIFSQNAGTGGEDLYLGPDSYGNFRVGDDWQDTGVPFPSDDVWHHFAVVKNSSYTFLYLDGNLVATKRSAINNPAGTEFRIARQYGVYGEYFKGEIDEISVWDIAQSATQIREKFLKKTQVDEPDLKAFFNLDEGSGTTIADNISNYSGSFTNMEVTNWVESGVILINQLSPVANAVFHQASGYISLSLSFDRNIIASEDGFITLHKSSTDSSLGTYRIMNEYISGNQLSVQVEAASLDRVSNFYVTIDDNAIKDESNNFFKGLSDNNIWKFACYNNTLIATGASSNGNLGVGISVNTNTPQIIPDISFGNSVAGGLEHTLFIDSFEKLWITGLDANNQYGDGSTISSSITISQPAIYMYDGGSLLDENKLDGEVKSIAAGSSHTLIVINQDGITKAVAAGEGSSGQLGDGIGSDCDGFVNVEVPTPVKKVRAFGNNSYVITDNGDLYAFGENYNGSLGVGTENIQIDTPVHILSNIVDVAPGNGFTLALTSDGNVYAMGRNTYGQFGDGTISPSLSPKLVHNSHDIKAVAAGAGFSMFLHNDGSLDVAGDNSYGQLGLGDTATHETLSTVMVSGVTKISAGRNHALILTDDGELLGVGLNSSGQLGLGDFSNRESYATIKASGVADAWAVSDATFYIERTLVSLQILGLNEVYEGSTANFDCYATWADGTTSKVTQEAFWSENSPHAQLAINSAILDIDDDTASSTISITARYRNATTTKDVTVIPLPKGAPLYGNGYSGYSQLGLDTTADQIDPQLISSDNIIDMAAGSQHSLYVREDGAVYVMGNNIYGQLGTGDEIPCITPWQIMEPGSAIAVGAGHYHSFVVKRDGSLWGFGRNDEGQLDDSFVDILTPKKIFNTSIVEADGGGGHTVIRTTDGGVWTLGRGTEGQLGNNSSDPIGKPYLVRSSGVEKIAAGGNFTLLLDDESDLYGMGNNAFGQLGLISAIGFQSTPIPLAINVHDIAAGYGHSLFISSNGDLFRSGLNTSGQLGDNTIVDIYGFTKLTGFDNVTDIHAGSAFSLFKSGNSYYAMGNNYYGQFGNGTSGVSHNNPVELTITTSGSVAAGASHLLFTLPAIPILETHLSSITVTGAQSGGTILAEGDSAITTQGVCYGEAQDPDLTATCVHDSSTATSFTSSLTHLTANKTYNVRAYATNTSGTGYGNNITFTTGAPAVSFIGDSQYGYENVTTLTVTALLEAASAIDVVIPVIIGGTAEGNGVDYTVSSQTITIPAGHLSENLTITINNDGLTEAAETITVSMGNVTGANKGTTDIQTITVYDPLLPTVSTNSISKVSATSITGGGVVVDEGSATVTTKGICVGLFNPPTTSGLCTEDGSGSGSFTSTLTNLDKDKHYYIRAYATSEVGTSYGNILEVNTNTIYLPSLLLLLK